MNKSRNYDDSPPVQNQVPSPARFWTTLGIFLFFAVVLLWEEHKAHILGALPYLILLACPVIHIFMHHGHSHGPADNQKKEHDNGP